MSTRLGHTPSSRILLLQATGGVCTNFLCHNHVSGASPESCQSVSGFFSAVSPECFRNVSGVFPESIWNLSRAFPKSVRNLSGVFMESLWNLFVFPESLESLRNHSGVSPESLFGRVCRRNVPTKPTGATWAAEATWGTLNPKSITWVVLGVGLSLSRRARLGKGWCISSLERTTRSQREHSERHPKP